MENGFKTEKINPSLPATTKISPTALNLNYSLIMKEKFSNKLTEILKKFSSQDEDPKCLILNRIWCLNQSIIPLTASTLCGNLKLRFGLPENEYNAYKCNAHKHAQHTYQLINELKNYQDKDNENNVEISNETDITPTTSNFSADIETNLNDETQNDNSKVTNKIINKNHVHTCFATNHLGQSSMPLVLFPKNEFTPIRKDMNTPELEKTCFIQETVYGDFNELAIFTKWLKKFYEHRKSVEIESESTLPTILLVNSFLYKYIFKSLNQSVASSLDRKHLIDYCQLNNIFILFYPIETSNETFNSRISLRFKEIWKDVVMQFAIKENPNYTQLAIIQIIKQVLRKINQGNTGINIENKNSIRESFIELFKKYKSPLERFSIENVEENMNELFKSAISNGIIKIPAHNLNICEQNNYDSDKSEIENHIDLKTGYKNGKGRQKSESNDEGHDADNSANHVAPLKLTDQEVTELIEWINGMSKIGYGCLKYTYLRDLYAKHRANKIIKFSREVLANEKKWFDLVTRYSSRINSNACGLNEDEYLHRWYDENYWRMQYYNCIKQNQIESAELIWTFDIIHFPYNVQNNLLKAPEKDYENRPKNLKPRISVIFAFNAVGDYLQPFFIYPSNFENNDDKKFPVDTSIKTEETEENIVKPEENDKKETFALNGYVTCRVFEDWLSKCFLPYLKELEEKNNPENTEMESIKKNYLLLHCAKLAVIDTNNLTLCQKENVNLFNMTHENQMPFIYLFQKTLRNRQIDLFLDSWKKVTNKLGLSYHMKCKSRSEFFNVFTDAFQNCIEEIGNISQQIQNSGQENPAVTEELTSSQHSTNLVTEFKNKMINSFEQCQLWPINEEIYAEFITKANTMLSKIKSKSSEVITEDIEMEEMEETDSNEKLLKENNNVTNKDMEDALPNNSPSKRRSNVSKNKLLKQLNVSNEENLNSMKTKFDHREDQLTEDETDFTDMNNFTADDDTANDTMEEEFDNFEMNNLVNDDELINSEDSEDMSFKMPKKKIKAATAKKRKSTTKQVLEKVEKLKPKVAEKNKRKSNKNSAIEAPQNAILSDSETDIQKQIFSKKIDKVLKSKNKSFRAAETLIKKTTNEDPSDESMKENLSQGSLYKDLVSDLLQAFFTKTDSKKLNTEVINDDSKNLPLNEKIVKRIESVATISKTRVAFLGTLIGEIPEDIKSLSIENKDNEEKPELTEKQYYNKLSENVCNFYFAKKHLKFESTE